MLFNSYVFLIFFALFFPAYWLLGKSPRSQNLLILVASWIFYGWWDERFLVLVLVSTVLDYVGGMGAGGRPANRAQVLRALGQLWVVSTICLLPTINESAWIFGWLCGFTGFVLVWGYLAKALSPEPRRRFYMLTSICGNLGILATFKYFNFFADQLAAVAASVGLSLSPLTLHVILPVGISFYTFQTMSYTIDVYRGQMKPTHRLTEFSAYVTFFPQLVAGPIERAVNLLPQFFQRRVFSWQQVKSGVWLAAWGLFKKIVIADNLAPIADAAFVDPAAMHGSDLMAGLIAFTFQIYCDFSGYSDMARGLARTLGFEIMVNFRLPYFARSPSEFWRGWHISLSTWLRDYVYVPLGGNQRGRPATYRNLAATMLLGGLWHGANWTFVAWGAYQGTILIAYRMLGIDDRLQKRPAPVWLATFRDVSAWAIMFTLVVFGWLLFRATNMPQVYEYIHGVVNWTWGSREPWIAIASYCAPLLLLELWQWRHGKLELLTEMSGVSGITVKALLVYSLLFLASTGERQFIYFDF